MEVCRWRGSPAGGGYTAIAPSAFAGVTEWNVHTYQLADTGEGGHALVPPGGSPIAVAGPTVALAPSDPEPCAPRPPVRVQVLRLAEGVLQVTVVAGQGPLSAITVESGANWEIEPAPPFALPPDTLAHTFAVRRTGPGSVYVPIILKDNRGEWPTFVGGGASAF